MYIPSITPVYFAAAKKRAPKQTDKLDLTSNVRELLLSQANEAFIADALEDQRNGNAAHVMREMLTIRADQLSSNPQGDHAQTDWNKILGFKEGEGYRFGFYKGFPVLPYPAAASALKLLPFAIRVEKPKFPEKGTYSKMRQLSFAPSMFDPTSPQKIKAIISWLQQSPNLEELDLSDLKLSESTWQQIVEYIPKTLRSLKFNNTSLPSLSFDRLNESFSNYLRQSSITHLELRNINNVNFYHLLNNLPRNLIYLDMGNDPKKKKGTIDYDGLDDYFSSFQVYISRGLPATLRTLKIDNLNTDNDNARETEEMKERGRRKLLQIKPQRLEIIFH